MVGASKREKVLNKKFRQFRKKRKRAKFKRKLKEFFVLKNLTKGLDTVDRVQAIIDRSVNTVIKVKAGSLMDKIGEYYERKS